MANYPRKYICFASLLEASGIRGAATLRTNPRFRLCIGIYPARIQVAWQDVTIYLGIFIDYIFALERGCRTPLARWIGFIDSLYVLFYLLVQLHGNMCGIIFFLL